MASQTLEDRVEALEAYATTIINVSKKTTGSVENLEKAVRDAVKKINDADKVLSEYRAAVENGEAIASASVNEEDVANIVKKTILEYDFSSLVSKIETRSSGEEKKIINPPAKKSKRKFIIIVSIISSFFVLLSIFYLFSGSLNKKIKMDLPVGTTLMQNGKIIGNSTSVLHVDVDSEGKFVANGQEYQISQKHFKEMKNK